MCEACGSVVVGRGIERSYRHECRQHSAECLVVHASGIPPDDAPGLESAHSRLNRRNRQTSLFCQNREGCPPIPDQLVDQQAIDIVETFHWGRLAILALSRPGAVHNGVYSATWTQFRTIVSADIDCPGRDVEVSTQVVHVPIPGGSVVSAVRGTFDWSVRTASFLVSAPVRLAELLATAEQLVVGIQQILQATTAIIEAAARVTARVNAIADHADQVIDRTAVVVESAAGMVAELEPIAQKLLPHAAMVADSLSDEEIKALIDMIDRLPELERSAEALMPILATMESVAPEVHQLLLVTEDLRRAVVGIPGFKFLRGRGQAKLEDGDV